MAEVRASLLSTRQSSKTKGLRLNIPRILTVQTSTYCKAPPPRPVFSFFCIPDARKARSFFTTRTIPIPDCFSAAKPTSKTSKEIYVGMQGASEFVFSGVLGHFNYTPQLPEIANPVLLTFGRYDTMRPPVIDA
ncbi:pip, partial [Symbiodinium necroappetens]